MVWYGILQMYKTIEVGACHNWNTGGSFLFYYFFFVTTHTSIVGPFMITCWGSKPRDSLAARYNSRWGRDKTRGYQTQI